MTQNNNKGGFANLSLNAKLLDRLEKLNFTKPTPIQHQAIPIALAGEDLIGIAQTGTGKTLAFGLPIINKILNQTGTGLILVPTRELALQVEQSLSSLGQAFNLKIATLIGGTPPGPQLRKLSQHPQIIIATPGRLIDHLQQNKNILNKINTLVLDEADRMLDMGFEPQIKKILAVMPKEKRQTMLFSATMPENITKLANNYMRKPLRIEVAPAGTAAANIEQEVFIVPANQKIILLEELLKQYPQRILIFSRTKHGAKKITINLKKLGYKAAEIHSNKSLSQRTKALKDFKIGLVKILVATDIASRGIDVQNITVVINYDLPDNPEDYVHRIGRTARAGKSGKAISLAAPEQKRDLAIIEKLIRTPLKVQPLPPLKAAPIINYPARSNFHQPNRRLAGNKSRQRRPFRRGRRNGSHNQAGQQNYF